MADALHTPGVTSAAEARFDDAGLLAVGAAGLTSARTGVLAGPGSTALVTGTSSTSPMRYSVAAHHWVTARGVTSDGVYRGGAEAAVLVDTTAAPGSGSRVDVLWVKQQDASSTISADGTTAPQYGCTQGASSTGTPAVPAIPVGAEELARVTVTSAATRTDGAGVTITNTARQTVARGAPIPVRNQTERDAIPGFDGLEVFRLDLGIYETYYSGAWRRPTASTPPWTTLAAAASTYNAAAGASWADLPGLTGTITLPTGSTVDVEARIPRLRAEASGAVLVRLAIGGVVQDETWATVGAAAVEFPGPTLTGSVVSAGAGLLVQLQVRGNGGGGFVMGGESVGPRIRYRSR